MSRGKCPTPDTSDQRPIFISSLRRTHDTRQALEQQPYQLVVDANITNCRQVHRPTRSTREHCQHAVYTVRRMVLTPFLGVRQSGAIQECQKLGATCG